MSNFECNFNLAAPLRRHRRPHRQHPNQRPKSTMSALLPWSKAPTAAHENTGLHLPPSARHTRYTSMLLLFFAPSLLLVHAWAYPATCRRGHHLRSVCRTHPCHRPFSRQTCSLVTARRLRHLAAAQWWQQQHGDSLAVAAQRWQWWQHYGSSGGGRRFLQLGAGGMAVTAWMAAVQQSEGGGGSVGSLAAPSATA